MGRWTLEVPESCRNRKTRLMFGSSQVRQMAELLNRKDGKHRYVSLYKPGGGIMDALHYLQQLRHPHSDYNVSSPLVTDRRLGTDVIATSREIIKYKFPTVIVYIGSNDLITRQGQACYGRDVIGKGGMTYFRRLIMLTSLLKENLGCRRVYICSIHPRPLGGKKNKVHRWHNDTVRYLSRKMAAVFGGITGSSSTGRLSVKCIDCVRLFLHGCQSVQRHLYAADNVHLNMEGKERWAERIVKVINSHKVIRANK